MLGHALIRDEAGSDKSSVAFSISFLEFVPPNMTINCSSEIDQSIYLMID